jgi:Skp family chaperone for outer membrane proteins
MDSDNINDAADAIDVSAVSDAIRAGYRLPELTEEQKVQRKLEQEIWRWDQKQRDEGQRLEDLRRRTIADQQARNEAQIAAAEAARKARLERSAEIDRKTKEIELANLRREVTKQSWWQSSLDQAIRRQRSLEYRNSLMGELDQMIAQPTPEPEPVDESEPDLGSPNIADPNFNPGYWLQKKLFK